MTPLIVLPAAGASTRMRGRDKLLETIGETPLLRRQAMRALATGCPVAVTLRPDDTARRDSLTGLDFTRLDVADADEGMAASLRTAARALQKRQPLAILLPDVPSMDTDDIRAVLAAFALDGNRITRATDPDGRPGTPIIFPARLIPAFATLQGDEGGKALLTGEDIQRVAFADDRATADLDTPEAWDAWRIRTQTPS